MLTRMKGTPKGGGAAPTASKGRRAGKETRPSVLTSLPRVRPQRPSARRASKGSTSRPAELTNVLAGLPRARPQRASAKRAAARAARARSTPADPLVDAPTQAAADADTRPPPPRSAKREHGAPRVDGSTPRQGFENDPEDLTGSVQPPGGAELVTSAGELVGELAKVGVNTGARLLKDFVSRLPG